MTFLTDQQTLDDLTIVSHGGGASIYGLFNRTMTRQGAAVIEDMLRHPLSDAEVIRRRSAIFQCFQARAQGQARAMAPDGAQATDFPFRTEWFDTAEAYLQNTDERTRLSGNAQTLGNRVTNLIADDNEYKNIYKGVTTLIELLQHLQRFVERTPPDGYREESSAIASLLAEPELKPVLNEATTGKLPFNRVATHDTTLRFRHRATIRRLLQHVYQLDAYLAVARVATERKFAFPIVLGDTPQRICLENVYHPQIKDAVPNTVAITADQPVIFLTGANMAGKSTVMKSLGIAVFLAHTGFPVPASRMEFTVFDGIYTTINLPDNLGMGASHFYAEVLRVKKVAGALAQGRRLLVIFDELFRGTNVKDAYEATVALTSAFAGRRDSFFVISTHIIEAGEVLTAEDPGIRPLFMPTRMNGTKPVYTYQLEEGITADRHGMIIINNEGIPEMLRRGSPPTPPTPTFEADQQTLADLNLTGKYRPGSIFSLFNQTKTTGGERLLEALFSKPLVEADAINHHVARLRDIQRRQLNFPFTKTQLARIEDYLHAGAGGRLATTTSIFKLKMLAAIVKDERYAVIETGVQAVIKFLRDCQGFFDQFGQDAGPWAAEIREARETLKDTAQNNPTALATQHHLFGHQLNQQLRRLCTILYELDLAIAVTTVATQKGFTWPRARKAEDNIFQATGLRHPKLDNAVGNTLHFTNDSNTLFLTGANMAGKSTLMKSVGIALYLAHMGFPVAAEDMEFSVRDGLYSSINVPDDLGQGYSHFYAEVLRVKKVAEAVSAGRNLVVIFDELFKGTNVKDAYDATLSVTQAFSTYTRCLFIVSTHIIEVGDTLKQTANNIQFSFLPTIMEGTTPRYPYLLKTGITSDRHGMVIINNEGILNLLKK